MLADTQLVTGASIQIVMFSRHCTVTQYHFFIGTLLALTAFSAFGATLTIVHDGLSRSHFKRAWRLCWIVVVFSTLAASFLVVSNEYFMVPNRYGLSTQCVWDLINVGRGMGKWRVRAYALQLGLLLYSLLSIVVFLYPEIKRNSVASPLAAAARWLDRLPYLLYVKTRPLRKHHPVLGSAVNGLAYLHFVSSVTVRDVSTSTAFEMVRIIGFLQFTTRNIVRIRNRAVDQGRQGDEDSWGFGQILPLLLLALPLFTLIEELVGK